MNSNRILCSWPTGESHPCGESLKGKSANHVISLSGLLFETKSSDCSFVVVQFCLLTGLIVGQRSIGVRDFDDQSTKGAWGMPWR